MVGHPLIGPPKEIELAVAVVVTVAVAVVVVAADEYVAADVAVVAAFEVVVEEEKFWQTQLIQPEHGLRFLDHPIQNQIDRLVTTSNKQTLGSRSNLDYSRLI